MVTFKKSTPTVEQPAQCFCMGNAQNLKEMAGLAQTSTFGYLMEFLLIIRGFLHLYIQLALCFHKRAFVTIRVVVILIL